MNIGAPLPASDKVRTAFHDLDTCPELASGLESGDIDGIVYWKIAPDTFNYHWGSRKIPIRNVIVMTNKKPKVEFKHVKVLSLSRLNGYIQYFDQVLSDKEVKSIFEYLKNRMNTNRYQL